MLPKLVEIDSMTTRQVSLSENTARMLKKVSDDASKNLDATQEVKDSVGQLQYIIGNLSMHLE